jgi:hypothetical protein
MDVGIVFAVVLPVGVNERLLVRLMVRAWPEGTVITTGDQVAGIMGGVVVAADSGFNAAQLAVDVTVVARGVQKYPHIGTVVPSGCMLVVGAAVRLTCCWAKLALAPNRRIQATSTAAFRIALVLKSLIRIVLSVN